MLAAATAVAVGVAAAAALVLTGGEGEVEVRSNSVAILDPDDGEVVEPLDIPMADLSGEELSGEVIPRQTDEFTCSVCFLVQHRNRIAEDEGNGEYICVDCA